MVAVSCSGTHEFEGCHRYRWCAVGAQNRQTLAGTVGKTVSGYCSRQASPRKVLSHYQSQDGTDCTAANILTEGCGQVNKVVRGLLQTVPTAPKMQYSSMGQCSGPPSDHHCMSSINEPMTSSEGPLSVTIQVLSAHEYVQVYE